MTIARFGWMHNDLMQNGFRLLVQTLCATGVKDTQCGFKLFTREVGVRLSFFCGVAGAHEQAYSQKSVWRFLLLSCLFEQAAQKLFPVQHIENWAFDVELLFLAGRLNIAVRCVTILTISSSVCAFFILAPVGCSALVSVFRVFRFVRSLFSGKKSRDRSWTYAHRSTCCATLFSFDCVTRLASGSRGLQACDVHMLFAYRRRRMLLAKTRQCRSAC